MKNRVYASIRESSPSDIPGGFIFETRPGSSPGSGLTAGKSFSHHCTSHPNAEGIPMTPSAGQSVGT